ncbi:MAG: ABC transporter substrate-binding protein [Dehalococcoidia bacterium]|nr:ABC transporter substrate-binding protein [Dehalococcoidia bacterium]
MRSRNIRWHKLAAMVLVLALLMPALVACDDDDEEDATMPSTTTLEKTTPAATVSKEPVKIGILMSWTGPASIAGTTADTLIKLVDNEMKMEGGINVGGVIRPIEWVRYDDKTQVADNVAGYKKLVLDDHVSAVVFGGATATSLTAASDSAEELHVPLFSLGSTPADLSNRPYTIRCLMPNLFSASTMVMDFVLKDLKPKTVGFLVGDMKETRDRTSMMKERCSAAGVKVVYEQFVTSGTVDFSPFLTRIRMDNPDVLFADSGGSETFYINLYTQMPALGGWGNIKLVSPSSASGGNALNSLENKAGAEGSYHWVLWAPGLPYAGAKAFEQAYEAVLGKRVQTVDVNMYYPLSVALKAIELAGSDKPADIAKAARSGNFLWEDAPGGPFTITADGIHNNTGHMMQVKDGKLISVGE